MKDQHKEKPPLGITPEYLWQWERVGELIKAINRRLNTGVNVPIEWADELKERIERRKYE